MLEKQLIVAATADRIAQLEKEVSDATAGRWKQHIQLIKLSDTNRVANDTALRNVSATHPDAKCFADKNVTSRDLHESGILRMAKAELINKTIAWLDEHRISWRGNVDECMRHGAYNWMDVDEWRQQFKWFDPVLGPSVAIAILAQLRIVGMQEFATFLNKKDTNATHSTYFMGSDPHSGDHGVAMTLIQIINNQKLSEAFKLPKLESDSTIRIFNDGAWSGGESSRRLKCLYQNCDRKSGHIEPTQALDMHFAFITDIAEKEIQSSIDQLEIDFGVRKEAITLSCPKENKLRLVNDLGETIGLAFRDPHINRYVDPAKMEALCKKIGKKITGRRPLGTQKIASTIGFWHSLPKAMLPVLIMGGGPIRNDSGDEISWRPLIASQHVLRPEQDDPSYHCSDCPLSPRAC
jgi:hypothetical protein